MRQPAQLVKKEFLTSWWTGEQALPPLPSSIRNGRPASSHRPALTLARCSVAAHCARPSCAPHQFPLKSCGFSSAETARKRFLLWKMGFSVAACCEPMHPSIQHGRSTALASSLAALPTSLGLLRAVSRTARALRAPPPYTPPGTIEARMGLARSPWFFDKLCGLPHGQPARGLNRSPWIRLPGPSPAWSY